MRTNKIRLASNLSTLKIAPSPIYSYRRSNETIPYVLYYYTTFTSIRIGFPALLETTLLDITLTELDSAK